MILTTNGVFYNLPSNIPFCVGNEEGYWIPIHDEHFHVLLFVAEQNTGDPQTLKCRVENEQKIRTVPMDKRFLLRDGVAKDARKLPMKGD